MRGGLWYSKLEVGTAQTPVALQYKFGWYKAKTNYTIKYLAIHCTCELVIKVDITYTKINSESNKASTVNKNNYIYI